MGGGGWGEWSLGGVEFGGCLGGVGLGGVWGEGCLGGVEFGGCLGGVGFGGLGDCQAVGSRDVEIRVYNAGTSVIVIPCRQPLIGKLCLYKHLVSRGTSVRIRFGSPFSSKVVVCRHCLVTLSLTIMKH